MPEATLSDTAHRRWRSIPRTEVAWREWADECVVYCRPSGRTHLLSADGAAVFLALLDAEKDVGIEELGICLRNDDAPETPPDSGASLHAILIELERSGLVEADTA